MTLSIISIAYSSSIVCSSWISHRVNDPVRTKGNLSILVVLEKEPANLDRSLTRHQPPATRWSCTRGERGAKVLNQRAGGEALPKKKNLYSVKAWPSSSESEPVVVRISETGEKVKSQKKNTQKKEAGNYVGPISPTTELTTDAPLLLKLKPLPFSSLVFDSSLFPPQHHRRRILSTSLHEQQRLPTPEASYRL